MPISDFIPDGLVPLHAILSSVGLLIYAVGSHALQQRRHPAAAIGWVLLILLMPEVGLPLYLMFGTRKLPKAVRRADARAEPGPAPAGVPDWVHRLTASMALPAPASYQALHVHADGADARLALWDTIASARTRLDVCTFILGSDDFGDEVLDRLAERARAGVAVRLIVDGVGTWMGGRRDFTRAAEAGVQVARFAPPFRAPLLQPWRGRTNLRTHRKVVIADGLRLWGGGRNLSGEYFEGRGGEAPWADLSFDLRGALVQSAQAQFDADWVFANARRGGAFEAAGAAMPGAPDAVVAAPGLPIGQMIPSGPDFADDTVHALLITSCYRARDRILIVTPYLVPDENLLTALALAARRGVVVDVVMPARSNHRLADIARRRPMRDLAAAGARLWLTPTMTHAKAVVVDRHMALAGSVNLDSRSLFLNFELMTAFYVPSEIARFEAWIDALRHTAQRARPQPVGLARHVGEGLVLWLAFQL
ncbi:MAG TPA: phospholipase D-like domain-containing protein [Quisquiliibacterium sp.]|nr:phospholipase D-like domain-containing protein [Quisquiliibacterium sp.]HQN13329.1 phospholipase D-like domain-containing protein [Quisquiliibacterium sp.]